MMSPPNRMRSGARAFMSRTNWRATAGPIETPRWMSLAKATVNGRGMGFVVSTVTRRTR